MSFPSTLPAKNGGAEPSGDSGLAGRLASLRLSQLMRNPYSDLGLNFFTLKWTDEVFEHGFASQMSKRLARACIFMGGAILVMEAGVIAFAEYDPDEYESDDQFKVETWSLMADAGIGAIGLALLVGGLLASRFAKLRGALALELVVLASAIAAVLVTPFTDFGFLASLTGHKNVADMHPHCDVWFALCLDCAVTFVGVLPVRWSSVWALHFTVIFVYPVARFINPYGIPENFETIVFTLTVLSLCSAVGKRTMEVQERRLFYALVAERTLRVESEYKLSLQIPSQNLGASRAAPTAPSCASSLETAEVFEVGAAQNVGRCLQHIKDKAVEEQWAISPEELSIFTSKPLGAGSFGSVMAGMMSGLPVAVKIPRDPFTADQVQPLIALATELRSLRKIRHPNVVMFYGALVDPPVGEVALVLEDIHGKPLDIFVDDWMSLGKLVPEKDLYRLAGGMALALRFLHGHRPSIVHADLKPSNVLVEVANSGVPRPKLVDFGLSRILAGKVKEFGGTISWLAPELVQGDAVPDTMVDVYGYGRLALFITTGEKPFKDWPRKQVMRALGSGDVQLSEIRAGAPDVAAAVWEIGTMCVAADPCERPRMGDVSQTLQTLAVNETVPNSLRVIAREIWGRGLFRRPESQGRTLRDEVPALWPVAIRELRQPQGGGAEEQGDANAVADGAGVGLRVAGRRGGALQSSAEAFFDSSISSSGSSRSTVRRRDRASRLPRIAEGADGEHAEGGEDGPGGVLDGSSTDGSWNFSDQSGSGRVVFVLDKETGLPVCAGGAGADASPPSPAGAAGGLASPNSSRSSSAAAAAASSSSCGGLGLGAAGAGAAARRKASLPPQLAL